MYLGYFDAGVEEASLRASGAGYKLPELGKMFKLICAVLCCAVLCCAMPCCAASCSNILTLVVLMMQADTPNTSSCELDNLSTSPSESHIADSNKDAGPGASRGVDEGWEIAAPRSPRRTHSNNFRKFDRAGSSGSRSLRSTASYNSAYGSA